MYTNKHKRTTVSERKIAGQDFRLRDVGYTEASEVTADVTAWALRENDVIDDRKVAVSTPREAVRADFQKSPEDIFVLYAGRHRGARRQALSARPPI
ncbi:MULTISPECIES: hypothetical protein [Serratia]|uniref:hypothetical protein n=1 Tax=Serratia TaxID=613 RepID=UPI001CDA6520|nr:MULTISPECIES: hypothetical protein [Serratia]MCK1085940.1 hypothetical protein [Serratia marcescens]MCT4801368.1 hypothetical protein [Serratia marcescens]MDH2249407.1 hypothetical protein [Serratia marcescens]MDH2254465.1 hypothetical protein [Serratia marcescens]MDH2260534.1 hypothetical protein [Serratia marcescens]